MNKNCIKYLSKLLCLKVCFLEDSNEIISPELLNYCTWEIKEYENYHLILIDYHKDKSNVKKYAFFATFSEKKTSVNPIEGRINWKHIILIAKATDVNYTDPNVFGLASVAYDILASPLFVPFRCITNPEEEKLLLINNKGHSIPKINSWDLVHKICYGKEKATYKYVRFYYPNIDSGVEYHDRRFVFVS